MVPAITTCCAMPLIVIVHAVSATNRKTGRAHHQERRLEDLSEPERAQCVRTERKDGAPVTVVRTFSILDPSASYTLRVYNGGRSNQFAKISSAVITLNGLKILRPNDFNQQVTLLQRIGGPVKRLQARDSW